MYGNQYYNQGYGNQYNRNAGYGNYYNGNYYNNGYGELNSSLFEMQERRQAYQDLPRTFSFYLMFVDSKLVSDALSLLCPLSILQEACTTDMEEAMGMDR